MFHVGLPYTNNEGLGDYLANSNTFSTPSSVRPNTKVLKRLSYKFPASKQGLSKEKKRRTPNEMG